MHWEIIFGCIFVLAGTYVAYTALSQVPNFWSEQNLWSGGLLICWFVVALGYWNQGSIIHKAKSATHVSMVLPFAVFVVQCILFVKGIYYHDMSLVAGALLVNSAVSFDLYQIVRYHK